MKRRVSWKAVLLVFGGLLVGLVAGWVLGNWSACSGARCTFDVDLFGAAGTWVGGLGTIGALVFAGFQLRGDSEERWERRREARLRDEKEAARREREAAEVRAEVRIRRQSLGRPEDFVLKVSNRASETPVYNVRVQLDPYVREHRFDNIQPQMWDDYTFGWQESWLERVPGSQTWAEWVEESNEKCIIEFDMNGERWRRTGSQAPIRISA